MICINIRNKNKNIDSVPVSSIKIDNSSSYGNGYTELVTVGDSVGTGVIRVVMNSTIDYEVFFKLSHNANWIDMDVKI